MFYYFGYGSNMDLTSIQAKGVQPLSSSRATLPGWSLKFNVAHYFRHEGGVGNIQPSSTPGAAVQGVVHLCRDEHLPRLDAVEAYGVGYDRIEVELASEGGNVKAIAYVGMDGFIDDSCLPTRRYLNILVKGASNAGLEAGYIDKLRRHPVHRKKPYAPFEYPASPERVFNGKTLERHPALTAVAGAVFDMTGARWEHEHLAGLFGGKDMTLFHLKRMDSSDGSETLDDIRRGRLSEKQRQYLNEYLHEYNEEYSYAGRFEYE